MEIHTSITVDLETPFYPQIVKAKQYDADTRFIDISMTHGGIPYTIPQGVYATFSAKRGNGTAVIYDSEAEPSAITIANNAVTVKLLAEALSVAGMMPAQVSLYSDGEKLSTLDFFIDVKEAPVSDDAIATDYVNLLTGFVNRAETAATNAEEWATSILDVLQPVGSILMTADPRNPAEYIGGGTWVAWGSGRVPVGVDSGQTEFNSVEKTGGNKNMQAHAHPVKYQGSSNRGTDNKIYGDYGASSGTTANFMTAAASSGAGTLYRASLAGGAPLVAATEGTGDSQNLQPYITCYMWKRTA